MSHHWYVVHSKIRQERVALENLVRQGFECFLPEIQVEAVRRGALKVVAEPLFPRYLFIRLSTAPQAQGWSSIRSTLGVSRLVMFGQAPAKVPDELIEALRANTDPASPVLRRFNPGDAVVVTQGPFAGLEAIYQAPEGEQRVMVLLNILSKDVRMSVSPAALRRAD